MSEKCTKCGYEGQENDPIPVKNGLCIACWIASQQEPMTYEDHREMMEGRKRTILREGE